MDLHIHCRNSPFYVIKSDVKIVEDLNTGKRSVKTVKRNSRLTN